MPASQIYFDNNATTYLDPRVAASMHDLSIKGLGNPASQHRCGRDALRALESAKESLLNGLGAPTSGMSAAQVILTSGGTEANNLALHAYTHQRPGLVIVGAMEHPSLLLAAELSALCLNPVRLLPGLENGQYDLDRLGDWLQEIYQTGEQVALVSLMLANNETGVINPIHDVVKLCQPLGIPVHCDIIQAAGKLDFDLSCSGVSAITVNAHKIHGPIGIGALIVNEKLDARPVVIGGGQQLGWRAGTEPVALAAGLAHSLELAAEQRTSGAYERVAQLRDLFEHRILSELDFVRVNGQSAPRVPQTSNLAFVGLDRQALQMALDLAGLACSSGAACSSGSSRPSATLVAMDLPESVIAGSLRFSLSRLTTETEVETAAEIVVRVAKKLWSARGA